MSGPLLLYHQGKPDLFQLTGVLETIQCQHEEVLKAAGQDFLQDLPIAGLPLHIAADLIPQVLHPQVLHQVYPQVLHHRAGEDRSKKYYGYQSKSFRYGVR